MEHAIYKLKLKIGANEFDAEGPADVVQAQFDAFRELILEAARMSPPVSVSPSTTLSASLSPSASASPSPAFEPSLADVDDALNRIMRVEDRVVSLTVRARSVDDAVLLLVYGQKMLRNNDAVTGAEVMSGLTGSGLRVLRADRLLEKGGEIGDLIVVGIRRAKRYRLTNAGMNKARQLAADLIATVA